MLTRSETLSGFSGCRVRQWGSFALQSADGIRDLTPRSRKTRAIVAYLISHPGTKIPRERIADLLWGDREEAHARASLRQALLEIRSATEVAFLEADREHVWIPAERIIAADEAEAADSPLFDDLNHVSGEFDAWLTVERNRRTAEILGRHSVEVERLLAEQRGAEAIPLVDRMARIDPYDETILCLAMRAEFQANRPSAIQHRYQETEARNRLEFGVGLPAEIRALHDRLLTELCAEPASDPELPGEEAAAPAERPPLQPTRTMPTALGSVLLAASVLGGHYWIGTASARTAEPATVAVLPFRALGGVDPYLVDGFSEELLSDLARNPGLRVTGRTSAWVYKDKADDVRRIGRNLRVDYVVEGSVRRSGGRMFVTAALVSARDGRTVWTQRFDGARGIDLPIQASIGEGILSTLKIGGHAVAARMPRQDAYQLYLRAKGLFREREKTSTATAGELLRQAVRMDPDFAPAWALLGGTIQLRPASTGPDWRRQALDATGRALRLDPNSADAHAMRALVLGFDSEVGRAHLARALRLNPNDSQTMYWWGAAAGASANFRLAEAANARATVMDPLWHRPVAVAIRIAVDRNDLAAANRHLATIKAGNPDGAITAEVALAMAAGDLSRVVSLADRRSFNSPTSLAYQMCEAWIAMGSLEKCNDTGAFIPGIAKQLLKRQEAPQNELVREIAGQTDPWLTDMAAWELLRSGRYEHLIELSAIPGTRLHGLNEIRPGNRLARLASAGRLALALEALGRKEQARAYWKAADEAGRHALNFGNVPDEDLLGIAANEAARGRRGQALALLVRTEPHAWHWLNRAHGDIGEDPMFASLRSEPRFQQLRQRHLAWRTRERREAEVLQLQ